MKRADRLRAIAEGADDLVARIRHLSGQVFLAHLADSDLRSRLSGAGDLLVVLAGIAREEERRLFEASSDAEAVHRDAKLDAVDASTSPRAARRARRSPANLPQGGCRDCGRYDAITGHQECEYPGRYSERDRDVDIGGIPGGGYGS